MSYYATAGERHRDGVADALAAGAHVADAHVVRRPEAVVRTLLAFLGRG